MRLTVRVADLPKSFGPYGAIHLLHQHKRGFSEGRDGVFEIELSRKTDRSGIDQWAGDSVYFHGDKRRFLYFTWFAESGQSFRRIKVYLDQIADLDPEIGASEVTIQGIGKDGSPACATARIIQ